MSRALRLEFPGAFYHVMARGNERRAIFLDQEDRQRFLELVGEAAERWQIAVHAYVLMPNHFHLLLESKGGFLSLPMRHINGLYTQFFNRKNKRVGHLLQGRFKALLVEKDAYLLTLSRYIHQNPVKAKLCRDFFSYPWSSARFYTDSYTKKPFWLETQDTLDQFGIVKEKQVEAYRKFLEAGMEKEEPWKKSVGQLILGSESFVDAMKEKIKILKQPSVEVANRKELQDIVPSSLVLKKVCSAFDIQEADLFGGRWRHGFCRPLAMTLLRNKSALTLEEIAKLFGVGYSAVSRGIMRLEARIQNDPELKEKLVLIQNEFEKSNVKT